MTPVSSCVGAASGLSVDELRELDRPYVTERVVRQGTMTGTQAEMRETLKRFEATGAAGQCSGASGYVLPMDRQPSHARISGVACRSGGGSSFWVA